MNSKYHPLKASADIYVVVVGGYRIKSSASAKLSNYISWLHPNEYLD